MKIFWIEETGCRKATRAGRTCNPQTKCLLYHNGSRAISREAARRRRKVESDKFAELSGLLPLQPSARAHLDKPAIIRLTLSYLRVHTLLKGLAVNDRRVDCPRAAAPAGENGKAGWWGAPDERSVYLKVLGGFLMVLYPDGNMTFLSDNVCAYMGLTQAELMGHNIFEFAHPGDHEEIKRNLLMSAAFCGERRDFSIRIKSALTHRGRSATLRSATWKVLHCEGRVTVPAFHPSHGVLLLTCRPLPLSHTVLNTHTFTSQHSMDMRFIYCDQRVTRLLGYSPEELLGRSVYDFCHMPDAICLQKSHFNLCHKSQSVSGRYRTLVKGGGYVWVETHSAVVPAKFRPTAHQPPHIFSITYILSGVEEPFLRLSVDQTGPFFK